MAVGVIMAVQRIAIVNAEGEVWSVCEWDEEAAPDWRPPLPEHRIVRDPPDFVGVGWKVDKQTREWFIVPSPRRASIPLAEFLDRFTEAEQLAMIAAEGQNPRVRSGLEVLQQLGALTEVRVLAVLV